MESHLKARLVTYKDPLTGKLFRFVTNLFEFQSNYRIALQEPLEIDPFFKKIQNRTSSWATFFSDSERAWKTQVWMGVDRQFDIQRHP